MTSCLSCGSTDLQVFLDLGRTPLANALLSTPDPADEPTWPLRVAFCGSCALVQLVDVVPREELFSDYPYFSSFSDTVVDNARAIVEETVNGWAGQREGRLAVEVASNDGYLLQFYQRAGVEVLGIEPAANIAEVARERGIPTRTVFFGRESARALAEEGLRADVIHANNVLAHVDDLNGFVAGLRTLLADDGRAIVEFPYVRDLVEHIEFDTIYHEHLCYFSATAVDHLLRRHDLRLADVERLPIHGGSLRIFAAPGTEGAVSERVTALLAEEGALGLDRLDWYADFARRVATLRSELRALLARLREEGATIAAYGASAKGTTLLCCFGIGRETLEYVVDRSSVKQGLYTPGTHLPIRDPAVVLEDRPDYLLLLAWNHADEILAQQAAYRQAGGRFILPLPEPRIV